MRTSITLEDAFKAFMKNYEHLDKQNKYLNKQLGESIKNKRSYNVM